MNKGKRKLHVTEFCLYMIWTFCVTATKHHGEDCNQVREDKSGVCQERAQAGLAVSMGCLFHMISLSVRPEMRREAAFIYTSKVGPRVRGNVPQVPEHSVPLGMNGSLNIYGFPKFM